MQTALDLLKAHNEIALVFCKAVSFLQSIMGKVVFAQYFCCYG